MTHDTWVLILGYAWMGLILLSVIYLVYLLDSHRSTCMVYRTGKEFGDGALADLHPEWTENEDGSITITDPRLHQHLTRCEADFKRDNMRTTD